MMKETTMKFVMNNVGILLMWLASTVISWKILDRPSGWTLILVVIIIMSAGVTTAQIVNAGVERVEKVKKVKKT